MTILAGLLLGVALTLLMLWIRTRLWSFRAQDPSIYADECPAFDVRDALAGDYLCEGVLYDFTGAVRARFTASMHGRFDAGSGVLAEHFRYADGAEQRREWAITLLPGGRLEATADDIVGKATGEQSGNTLRMRYRLRLPASSGGLVVSVTDWLYLTETGVILNRSEMRKFGFRVAELFAVLKHRPAEG